MNQPPDLGKWEILSFNGPVFWAQVKGRDILQGAALLSDNPRSIVSGNQRDGLTCETWRPRYGMPDARSGMAPAYRDRLCLRLRMESFSALNSSRHASGNVPRMLPCSPGLVCFDQTPLMNV